jgi:hypothetical protein
MALDAIIAHEDSKSEGYEELGLVGLLKSKAHARVLEALNQNRLKFGLNVLPIKKPSL